jgi:hypothetical protein
VLEEKGHLAEADDSGVTLLTHTIITLSPEPLTDLGVGACTCT